MTAKTAAPGKQKLGLLSTKAENAIFDTINAILLVLVCIITLYPFRLTIPLTLSTAESTSGPAYSLPGAMKPSCSRVPMCRTRL